MDSFKPQLKKPIEATSDDDLRVAVSVTRWSASGVVIHTGEQKIKDKFLRFSDVYYGGKSSAIEVTVGVIVEDGSNTIINQYILFTKIVNKQVELYGPTKKAVEEIFRMCKERNILYSYVLSHEKEVIDLVTQIFNQKQAVTDYVESEKCESLEEGREEGRENGIKEAQDQMIAKMLVRGLGSVQDIAEVTNSTVDHVLAVKAELESSGQLPAKST